MILSKDFYIKDQLDNMNQISQKLGQVQSEIMSKRERQKKQKVDQMLHENQVLEQQMMQARQMQHLQQQQNYQYPINHDTNQHASEHFSSPSDFRFPRGNNLQVMSAQQFSNNNLSHNYIQPRHFEESWLMTDGRESANQTRISYDEVPLEEYFSNRVNGGQATNAQVYMRFKGFNRQTEMEEEYNR